MSITPTPATAICLRKAIFCEIVARFESLYTKKVMKHFRTLLFSLSLAWIASSCGGNGKISEVKDADGNRYPVVKIGSQTWMAENLKATSYNDGTAILNLSSDSLWSSASEGAYSWLNNDGGKNKNTYGAYYNWKAVSTGKLCPVGWHVPSDAEWRTLTAFLGGESVAGIRLKSDSGWQKNGNGTNESGFTAMPLGYRSAKGTFLSQGNSSYFWSSTENNVNAWYTVLFNKDATAFKYFGAKQSGFSVRCVRDNR